MTTLTEETPGAEQVPYARSESTQSFHEAAETPPVDDIGAEGGSPADRVLTGASAMQEAGDAARANRGLHRFRTAASAVSRNERPTNDEYHSDVVDLLDLVGTWQYSRILMSGMLLLTSLQTPKSVHLAH